MDTNDLNSLKSFHVNFKSAKHDLNNLLNNVLNAVDLLKEKGTETNSRDYLVRQIERNTILASKILTNLHLEKSVVNTYKTKIDLKPLVEDTIKLVTADNVNIELDIKDDEFFIYGNHIEIQRILLNLIANSIETKKENLNIKLKLKRVHENETDNFIELSIADNGIGISEENLTKIFTKGYSTKSNSSNRGLGLSIVKEILEDHSSKLEVKSELNVGSTFNIYFPIYNQNAERNVYSNKKVIIAEDDDFQREVLSDLLRSMEINVFTASNGVEALDLYYSKNPDLLFLDEKMPGMTGLECINKIRTNNLVTEIVLVTGSYDVDIELRDDLFRVLNKPYSFDEVKLILKELL